MKHVLDKAYSFEGEEYSEIDIDLESLTGRDISAAKKEWNAGGGFSPVPATDPDYCVIIAARAAKKPLEFFLDLPARDYSKIAQAVSNFLIA